MTYNAEIDIFWHEGYGTFRFISMMDIDDKPYVVHQLLDTSGTDGQRQAIAELVTVRAFTETLQLLGKKAQVSVTFKES